MDSSSRPVCLAIDNLGQLRYARAFAPNTSWRLLWYLRWEADHGFVAGLKVNYSELGALLPDHHPLVRAFRPSLPLTLRTDGYSPQSGPFVPRIFVDVRPPRQSHHCGSYSNIASRQLLSQGISHALAFSLVKESLRLSIEFKSL